MRSDFRSGDRISWKYTHSLNSVSKVQLTKKGEYIGKVKHQARYWNKRDAVQMCYVHFDGNIKMSKVSIYDIKK